MARSSSPAVLVLAAALLAPALPARARDVPLGVPDLALRFDNTLRYNLGLRTDPVNAKIAANPVFTEGETSVRQGGLSTDRLDLLSELDLAWLDRAGARVSAAAWYDDVYRDHRVTQGPGILVPPTYTDGDLSRFTLRRYRGPWGELLDAFAWAAGDVGGVPVTVKAGRHALAWGESLFLSGAVHGVGYAQAPLDLQKGFATPGIEAKELYRPLASVSAQAQLTPELSVAGQVFLEWQSFLYPEGGTFVGAADFAFNGPDGVWRLVTGAPGTPPTAVYYANDGARRPSDLGDYGAAVRWRPELLDGTLGLYYRRTTDKLAAVLLTGSQYAQYYGTGIDIVGLSLSKNVLGVSIGAEASYRHDMPLLAQSLGFAAAPAPPLTPVLFPHGAPALVGNTYQARGDTVHGVLNAVGIVNGGRAFSTASWALELTYSRWLTVRDNPDMFFGLGYGVCRSDPALAAAGLQKGEADGCATRDHLGVGAGFTPTWFRPFSGVDVLLPLSVSWTVRGNSPVTLGGNEGSGTYGGGVALDVRNAWRVDLRYADFFGRTRDDGTRVTSANGQLALLKNRGSVTLTAKATF